jgi:uncharacterized protein with NRDE domain
MCLILVGWQLHPAYPLVVAANRDEFHARPTAAAAFWQDAPGVFGGRDLEAGGTWLGASRDGRFAAVTNVREPGAAPGKRSRGELTAAFLAGRQSAAAYAEALEPGDYAGFNLLLADAETLVYVSNRDTAQRTLPPGIYGLSNHRLDTPWPKLLKARENFSLALGGLPDEAAFFELLADRSVEADEDLPNTGVPLAWERLLSAVFVHSADYGTRASTLLLRDRAGQVVLHEKSFAADGTEVQSSRISTVV